MSPRFVVVGGGVRSGKSTFALQAARRLGSRRTLIATAQPLDDEMRERIAAHRRERGAEFDTLEEPLDLPGALDRLATSPATPDVVVVDCLTLWLSNLLLRGDDATAVEGAVERLAAAVARRPFHVVVVTNEVGLGVVPPSPLGRTFRDVAGRAHQRLAPLADHLYFAALGCILRLKPGPLCLVANDGDLP